MSESVQSETHFAPIIFAGGCSSWWQWEAAECRAPHRTDKESVDKARDASNCRTFPRGYWSAHYVPGTSWLSRIHNVQPLSFYRSLSFVNFSARSASRSPFSQCLKILQDSRLSRFSTEVERFFVELLKALSLFFWKIHPLRKFLGRNWNFGIAKLLELILMIWRRFISTKDRFFSNRGKLHLC